MDLFVYTQTAVEDLSLLAQMREWKKEGDGWVCEAKNWQIVVNGSEPVETADIGPEKIELMRVRPEVRYRTEINIEGRQSSEAMVIAVVSAQRVAFRLCGVIYDPQQDVLILPLSEGLLASLSDASAAARSDS